MRVLLLLVLLVCCCNDPATAKKSKRPARAKPVKANPQPKSDPFAKSDRITSFENTVTINKNGTLSVTEQISIYNGDGDTENADTDYLAAGGGNNEIKRGIIRTFPTKYLDEYKLFRNTTFRLRQVLMNGEQVPWHLSNDFQKNGYVLRIGDASRELPEGRYTYTITYETEHQIKYLEDYDELVWNVTGNGWNFRIEKALCRIIVPGNDTVFSVACYTGLQGDTTRNCSMAGNADTFVFYATTALRPYEGLTAAVSWRKGLLQPLPWYEQAWWLLKNNTGYLGMFFVLIIILVYNTFKWWRYGRDLRPGTIVIQYEPPAGLSPAAMGYTYFQKMNNKLTAATITDLALRNLFTIAVEKKGLIFKDNEYTFNRSALPFEEAGYEDYKSDAEDLIGTSIRKGHYNEDLGDLHKTIARDLDERYEGTGKKGAFFSRNSRYLAFGYISIPVFFALIFVVSFNAKINPWAYIPLVAGFVLCMVVQAVFARLMPAYNSAGRKQLDYIEGYRRYLKTTDENRLNMMNPPEKTIDLFEKNLAFAIALDCEVEWGKKFEDIIATASIDPNTHTVLYHNSSLSGSSGSSSSFMSGFSGAISSASTPPSSSSGGGSSFGGGSSGSGGGGGGGGGW